MPHSYRPGVLTGAALLLFGISGPRLPATGAPAPKQNSTAGSQPGAARPDTPELKRHYEFFGGSRFQTLGGVYSDSGKKLAELTGWDETVPALNGRYVRSIGSAKYTGRPAADYEILTTYDSKVGCYRQWHFSARLSKPLEWTGGFKNGKFVASTADGGQTTTYERLPNGDLQGTAVVKGPNGQQVTMRWTCIRTATKP